MLIAAASVSNIKQEWRDVLANHYIQNKPNNPPSAEGLLSAAKDQVGVDDAEDKEDEFIWWKQQ